jgi:hypothetical protein
MLGWFRHYSDNIGSSARFTVYKYSAVGQSAWEDIAGTRHAG